MSGNPPHGHQGYESGYTDGRPQPYGPPQRHVIGYHNQPMLHLSALQVAYVEDDRESSRQYESQLSGSSRATGYPQPEVERESRPVAPTLGDYNFNIVSNSSLFLCARWN
jgi:hypothetical protein